jgi:hypothetical protein
MSPGKGVRLPHPTLPRFEDPPSEVSPHGRQRHSRLVFVRAHRTQAQSAGAPRPCVPTPLGAAGDTLRPDGCTFPLCDDSARLSSRSASKAL